jgi:hypothetical protein
VNGIGQAFLVGLPNTTPAAWMEQRENDNLVRIMGFFDVGHNGISTRNLLITLDALIYVNRKYMYAS